MAIPKNLMEAKICNKDNCKIINELEEWLKKDEIIFCKLGTRKRMETLEAGALLYQDIVLDKLNELKEKYK